MKEKIDTIEKMNKILFFEKNYTHTNMCVCVYIHYIYSHVILVKCKQTFRIKQFLQYEEQNFKISIF